MDKAQQTENLFTGQVVLITGAAGGIGSATAEEFAAGGAAVALADLQAPAQLAEEISERYGAPCCALAMDVTEEDSVATAVASAEKMGSLSVLVNNAGIMQRQSSDHHTLPIADLQRMLSVHVTGSALVAAQVIPGMRERRCGRIINLSSALAHVGLQRRTAYATAKAAIGGLTRSLALENARHGITVNSVSPGYVLTGVLREKIRLGTLDYDLFAERTAVGRWAQPGEIARVIRFLAEPGSGFITAADWAVDGGYVANGNPGEDLGARIPFAEM